MRRTLSTFTKGINPSQENLADLRRGPWTLEEDNILKNYISRHGEGRWNLLAKCAGLKRTGKSCRLRWLNYLKPDIKRGNLTPQEQLLILQLHSKWGNRWSKIAQHLPGRTDNEIKNYWRTRVQKQARLLKIESNSRSFTVAVRNMLKQKLLNNNNYVDQNPPYNNSLATFPSPLLSTNISNDYSHTNYFHLLPHSSTANFSNNVPSFSSSSTTPQTQVTGNSSQHHLNTTTSSGTSPVTGHVPPIHPLKSLNPSGPSSHANSADGEKNAVPLHEHDDHDHIHSHSHSHFHVGFEDNYCVDSRSYDIEEFPMHTTSGTGDQCDMSLSTTGCQIEECDWDNCNWPGGYWNMDDIWQFRELEEFGM